eukprot:TRINITY_DN13824_c0_g1_i1.p1 TRINITY_DN13824_c0_g1~~TRINITY_DN13824_c0_g1_i1.p1  ORF type:complete len:253 (+),score=41.29 TRINITY_DN13824_c0_g1_i1:3-761(+)
MIRNLKIMGRGGITLFEKEWAPVRKSRMFGSLLVALQEHARQSVGLSLSYLELSTLAISLVTDDKTNLTCALIHDVSCGEPFARTIARQILHSFVATYSSLLDSPNLNPQPASFTGFGTKLVDHISSSSHEVLFHLHQVHGVHSVILYENDEPISLCSLQDPVTIAANLSVIAELAGDLMQLQNDSARSVSLYMPQYHLLLRKITEKVSSYLVCVCHKGVAEQVYLPEIDNAVVILDKIYELVSNLKSGFVG